LVSWEDAQQYVKWLSDRTGKAYRLLSEAEWEYAARGGKATRFSFGDEESKLGDFAWYRETSEGKAHPVGGKKPNDYGLHDMHGNVWEWVEDCYEDNYEDTPKNGSAKHLESCQSQKRVLRGGSWYYAPRYHRSARRNKSFPTYRDPTWGFRVGRTLTP
jgi:formylglycine-generating enzyme required for sulfatase activity